MSEKLSRIDRQTILDDFVERHGKWDAALFLAEVRATQGQHQAWSWFTWDDAKAADEHRLWEARTFSRDLVIRFSVEVIERANVVVREFEAPRVISPLETRQKGGGYVALDPQNPESMAAFCREAATSLRSWLNRYAGAVAYASGSVARVEKLIASLEAPKKDAA